MNQQEFLENKLVICSEENLSSEVDVFVNFCGPNIFTGNDLFGKLHETAGPELKAACENYIGISVTSVRLTDSFEAKNFKKIAHCILPNLKEHERFIEQHKYDLSLCIRNSLDITAENGYKTIAFSHPFQNKYQNQVTAKIICSTIKSWLAKSHYKKQLEKIVMMCSGDGVYKIYLDAMVNVFEEYIPDVFYSADLPDNELLDFTGPVDMRLLETLIQEEGPEQYENELYDMSNMEEMKMDSFDEEPEEIFASTSQYCMEKYGFDEAYIQENAEKLYEEMFKNSEGIQLQLSRNLSPTILTIEEEDGLLRQYRMTTQTREGDTSYFRCSKCESLMKHTNNEYRPKITVKNGYIVGSCYPEHHPQCNAMKKYDVILQQIDREARMNMSKQECETRGLYTSLYNDKMMMDPESMMNEAAFTEYKRPRGIMSSAKNRLKLPASSFYDPVVDLDKKGMNDVCRNISGDTLEAIRKCEDELNVENFGTSKISEEEFQRTIVGDLQGATFDNSKGVFYEDIVDEVYPPSQNIDFLDVNDMVRNDELQMRNGGNNLSEFSQDYPPMNYARNSRPNISYRIPYPEDSEGYTDLPEEEENPTATGNSNKCRKYRIIRVRRRTNVAFDWKDEKDTKPTILNSSTKKFNS